MVRSVLFCGYLFTVLDRFGLIRFLLFMMWFYDFGF